MFDKKPTGSFFPIRHQLRMALVFFVTVSQLQPSLFFIFRIESAFALAPEYASSATYAVNDRFTYAYAGGAIATVKVTTGGSVASTYVIGEVESYSDGSSANATDCSAPDIVIAKGSDVQIWNACNLGSITAASGAVSAAYGNHYQFGSTSNSWSTGSGAWNDDWKSPGGTDAWSANDWGVTEGAKMTATWANSIPANRTKMQGPCAVGYHVPTNAEIGKIGTVFGVTNPSSLTPPEKDRIVSALNIPFSGNQNWIDNWIGTGTLNYPFSAHSDGTRLFVVDSDNNRVLIWNSVPTNSNALPNVVLGQPNFTSNTANNGGIGSGTLNAPTSVYSDGTRLFVADFGNNRVLVWNAIPTMNGQSANVVLWQPSFTSNTANNGGIGAGALSSPISVHSDGSMVSVVDYDNHRVLVWNAIPTMNGQSANVVLGQPNFTSNTANNGGITAGALMYPYSVSKDVNGNFFVADTGNNRVLVWNAVPTANMQNANVVLWQPNFTSNTANNGGITAGTLHFPYSVHSDGTKLFVSDANNNRVLVWNAIPTANKQNADIVLGQPSFTSSIANNGGIGSGALNTPYSVSNDANGKMFVADYGNHRVLVWNAVPAANGQGANILLWQPDFVSNTANNGGIGVVRNSGSIGAWWTSSPGGTNGYGAVFNSGGGNLAYYLSRSSWLSVRCLRNASLAPTLSGVQSATYVNLSNQHAYQLMYTGVTDADSENTLYAEYSLDNTNWNIVSSGATPVPLAMLTGSVDIVTASGFSGGWLHTLYSRVRDGSESSPVRTKNITFDLSTPIIHSFAINSGATATASPIGTFFLSGSDTVSGLHSYRMSCNGSDWSTWNPYALSFTGNFETNTGCIAGDGTKTVYAQLSDSAENVANASGTILLDREKPVIFADNTTATWFNASPVIKLHAEDLTSGVYHAKYHWDGTQAECISSGALYSSGATVNVPSDGLHTLRLCAIDNAENEANPWDHTYQLDTVAPVTWTVAINGWASATSGSLVSLSLSGSDALSGIESMRFSCISSPSGYGPWYVASGSHSFDLRSGTGCSASDGNHSVYVQHRDVAGNVSTAISDSILLDTAAPSFELTDPVSTQWSTVDAVAVNVTDSGTVIGTSYAIISGTDCTSASYVSSGTLVSIASTNTGSVCFRSSDLLWNVSYSSPYGPLRVDTDKPAINSFIFPSPTKSPNPVFTLDAIDALSPLSQMKFSCDGTTFSVPVSFQTSYSGFNIASGTGSCPVADGPRVIRAMVSDSAGNWSTVSAFTGAIDTQKPAVSVTSFDNVHLSNSWSVQVSGSCSESLSPVHFQIGSATWSVACSSSGSYSLSLDLRSNSGTTIYVKQSDSAGNDSNVSTGSSMRDLVAPTASVELSSTGWTNTGVIASLSGISESITVLNTVSGSFSRTFTSNGDFTFSFVDAVGNSGTAFVGVSNIDRVNPLSTATFTGTLGFSGWYVSSVRADISVTETGSSVSSTNFCPQAQGSSLCLLTDSGTIAWFPNSGRYSLRYKSTDMAGNQEPVIETPEIKIDVSAPIVSQFSVASGATLLHKLRQTIAFTGSDLGSGLSHYRLSCQAAMPWNWMPFPAPSTVDLGTVPGCSEDGNKTLHLDFRDVAGNVSSISTYSFELDTRSRVTSYFELSGTGANSSLASAIVHKNGPDGYEKLIASSTGSVTFTGKIGDTYKLNVDSIIRVMSGWVEMDSAYVAKDLSQTVYVPENDIILPFPVRSSVNTFLQGFIRGLTGKKALVWISSSTGYYEQTLNDGNVLPSDFTYSFKIPQSLGVVKAWLKPYVLPEFDSASGTAEGGMDWQPTLPKQFTVWVDPVDLSFDLTNAFTPVTVTVLDGLWNPVNRAKVSFSNPSGGYFGLVWSTSSTGTLLFLMYSGAYNWSVSALGIPSPVVWVANIASVPFSLPVTVRPDSFHIQWSVTDPDNVPLSNLLVQAFDRSGRRLDVRTNASGAYDLVVAASDWTVSTWSDTFGQSSPVAVLIPANASQGQTFAANIAYSLSGMVILTGSVSVDSMPLPGASITADTASGTVGQAYSDANGMYRLMVRTGRAYSLRAYHRDIGLIAQKSSVDPDSISWDRNFVVTTSKNVRFVLTLPSALANNTDWSVNIEHPVTGFKRALYVRKSDTVTIFGLQPHATPYAYSFSIPGVGTVSRGTVTVSAIQPTDTIRTLDLLSLSVPAVFSGTVSDASGSSLSDALVELVPSSDLSRSVIAKSGPDGSYSIRAASMNEPYELRFKKQGYLSRSMTGTVWTLFVTASASLPSVVSSKSLVFAISNIDGISDAIGNKAYVSIESPLGWYGQNSMVETGWLVRINGIPDGFSSVNLHIAIDGFKRFTDVARTLGASATDLSSAPFALVRAISAPPITVPVVGSQGWALSNPLAGMRIELPASALGTDASSVAVVLGETRSFPRADTSLPIGDVAKEIHAENITSLNTDAVIELSYTGSDILATYSGMTVWQVRSLRISYFDPSASSWLPLPTTVSYDVPAFLDGVSDVTLFRDVVGNATAHIILRSVTDHFTLFTALISTVVTSAQASAPSSSSSSSGGGGGGGGGWMIAASLSSAIASTTSKISAYLGSFSQSVSSVNGKPLASVLTVSRGGKTISLSEVFGNAGTSLASVSKSAVDFAVGDILAATKEGSVQIALDGYSKMNIEPGASVKISEVGKNFLTYEQLNGKTKYQFDKRDGGSFEYKVRGKIWYATIRGTTLEVSTFSDKEIYSLIEGKIDVFSSALKKTVSLLPGDSYTIYANGKEDLPKRLTQTSTVSASTTATIKPCSSFADVPADSEWCPYLTKLVSANSIRANASFEPNRPITRAEFLKIVIASKWVSVAYDPAYSYSDIAKTDWWAPYVSTAKKQGYISQTNITFEPLRTISRAEAMKILIGVAGKNPIYDPAYSYSDIVQTDWWAPYVSTAKQLKVISQSNPVFRPKDNISRAESAKMVSGLLLK